MAGWSRAGGAAPNPIGTAAATRGNVEDRITAPGHLQPRADADIGPRLSRPLKQLYYKTGDPVPKGGVVMAILGLAAAATPAAFDVPILLSDRPVLPASGCAFGTGLRFGYMPAHKAATLDPVVALGAA